jgi:branched-chain amino acid transport system permease protein
MALVFGTTRVVNLAHGELVLLGAYVAYQAETSLGLGPLLAIPLATVVVVIAALATMKLVASKVTDREIASLLITFGVGVILTNAFVLVWSADFRSTQAAWYVEPSPIRAAPAMNGELLFFALAAAFVAFLWWWLSRTWYGRALRAVASNRVSAGLLGIRPGRTELLAFVVAALLATVAGAALYATRAIEPPIGGALTTKAFVITVLAGVGSMPFLLAGALMIGVVEALTAALLSPALQDVATMIVFLLVLFALPTGLSGLAGRRVVS